MKIFLLCLTGAWLLIIFACIRSYFTNDNPNYDDYYKAKVKGPWMRGGK